MTFSGFTEQAVDFYERLESDNTRTFWLANKPLYEAEIKEPMAALLATFPKSLGDFHVFRPNRDVRFSKNKEPYKTHHGAVTETDGGSMLYVQFSASGVMAACGAYMMSSDQLERYRQAIDNNGLAGALERAMKRVSQKGLSVSHGGFDPLKSAPRGYSKDHPRIELLRWKGVIASQTWTARQDVGSGELAALVANHWKYARPLLEWLDEHVGPSQSGA